MKKEFASLKNPGLLWFMIVLAYVIIMFFFLGSKSTWLGIPLVTWLVGGGGVVFMVIGLILIPVMFKFEKDEK